jgi:hypothetical protein
VPTSSLAVVPLFAERGRSSGDAAGRAGIDVPPDPPCRPRCDELCDGRESVIIVGSRRRSSPASCSCCSGNDLHEVDRWLGVGPARCGDRFVERTDPDVQPLSLRLAAAVVTAERWVVASKIPVSLCSPAPPAAVHARCRRGDLVRPPPPSRANAQGDGFTAGAVGVAGRGISMARTDAPLTPRKVT